MSLTAAPYVLGTHIYFFPSGVAYTVPGAGNASKTTKPGAADTGWIDMGIIEDSSLQREPGNAIEIWKPSPGQLRLDDIIRVKSKIMIKFKTRELSAVAVQCLLRTLTLTSASTQFNPLEGVQLKGWLKGQWYDQTDTLKLVLESWVELSISGELKFGSELAEPDFEATLLHSDLNTGTL